MIFPRQILMGLVITLELAPAPAWSQDAGAGAKVFQRSCSVYHSVARGETLVGPSLFGVVGREAGSIPDFRYSAATRDSKIIWSTEELDRYVTMPKEVVPGTTMGFRGLGDPKQRTDLIRYLETLR
jgi:cytochrome c